jgi:iron complex outermembrane receptor protein/vitamin B12 transporter
VKPGDGVAHGTKLTFNYSEGVQEPNITTQLGSLYDILQAFMPGLPQHYGIGPIGYQHARSFDGGLEQTLLNQRSFLRAIYFDNDFSKQIEFVPGYALTDFGLPENIAQEIYNLYGGAYVNSETYTARGVEMEFDYQPIQQMTLRVGYTHVDPVVERSLSSSALCNTALEPDDVCENPNIPGVLIGAYSPLLHARPFRIPPNTGFFEVLWAGHRWTARLNGTLVSRADDSTFLLDQYYGNTLLLPNRDLDPAYQRIDLGGSYAVNKYVTAYAQLDNLLSQQRQGILGYPALPFNFRGGFRVTFGAQ